MERIARGRSGPQDGSYEIYIPGMMDSDEAHWKHNTWEEEILYDRRLPRSLARPPPIIIPVKKVGHVTHFDAAESIIEDGPPELVGFQFNEKCGKTSGTYRANPGPSPRHFKKILPTEIVLPPGMYLWWSVCMPDDIQGQHPCEQIPIGPPSDAFYAIRSPCLASYYASVYGTIGMMVDFDVLLQSYCNLFRSGATISYKCGGTLFYRKEICRVIIVCCLDEAPRDLRVLPDFQFGTGRTVTLTRPYQGVKYIPNGDNGSGAVFHYSSSSWDTYVFAFHHPRTDYKPILSLPSRSISLAQLTHGVIYDDGTLLRRRGRITACHKNLRGAGCPDEKYISSGHAYIPFDRLNETLEKKKRRSQGAPDIGSGRQAGTGSGRIAGGGVRPSAASDDRYRSRPY